MIQQTERTLDKVLIVDAEKCTGCRVCELVCSMARDGIYNPKRSRIRVLRHAELDVSIPVVDATCDLCGKCTEWCFQEAIRFVEWGEAALVRRKTKLGRFPCPVASVTLGRE
jgi:anaerobic carbon-monoxide dehydrogenase iron sulfur subunit